jgi:hypothetical protein
MYLNSPKLILLLLIIFQKSKDILTVSHGNKYVVSLKVNNIHIFMNYTEKCDIIRLNCEASLKTYEYGRPQDFILSRDPLQVF